MEKSIVITSYFFIDGTVFIIWHWEWQEDISSDEDDRTSITVIPETPTISDSENSDDDSTTDLTASQCCSKVEQRRGCTVPSFA